MINTVCGPVSAEDLGVTLAHEHFVFGYSGHLADFTCGPFDRDKAKADCMAVLSKLKAHDVNTVIDATPNDQGRNPEFLKELSEESGVNIICSTGLYKQTSSGFEYFNIRGMFGHDTTQDVYEMMVAEITQGIGKTGIKAGAIKVATGKEIAGLEKMFFAAAGRASKTCDVPVMTHTESGLCADEQLDMLLEAGANPKRIIIGHLCDLEVSRRMMKRGANISYDRFGLVGEFGRALGCPEDEVKVDNLIQLIDEGFGDQILISNDYVIHVIGRPFEWGIKEWYTLRVHEFILPMLRERGLPEDAIQRLLVGNPKRIYG